MIIKIALLCALFLCAWQDIQKKCVTVRCLCVSAGMILVALAVSGAWNIRMILGGVAIGLLVLVLGRVTGGIGAADGIVLCMTGCCLGAMQNAALFFVALLFAAVVSLVFLICMKKPKNYELPFLPFLCMAYLMQIVVGV